MMRYLFTILLLFSLLFISVSSQDETFLPAHLEVITPENANRIEEVAMLGRGYAGEVAWSPDGSALAVASYVGVWLYHTQDWTAAPRLLMRFKAIGYFPDGSFGPFVKFSPDGHLLAFSSGADIHFWDMTADQEAQVLDAGQVTGMAFDPDGLHFVTSGGSSLSFWNMATWELEKLWTSPVADDYITFLNPTFSPDGSILATSGSYRANVRLWNPDAETLEAGEIANLGVSPFDDMVTSISFSLDGTRLAIGTIYGRDARFFDVNTHAEIEFVKSAATAIVYSPDGQYLAVTNSGYAHPVGYFGPTVVSLFNVETGEQVAEWQGHDEVRYLAFSPDSSMLVAVSRFGGGVRLWDVKQQKETRLLQEALDTSFIEFTSDGSWLGYNASVVGTGLLNLQTWETMAESRSDEEYTFGPPAITPGNEMVFVQVEGHWKIVDSITLNRFPQRQSIILPVSTKTLSNLLSPDGTKLLTTHHKSDFQIWDTQTGESLLRIDPETFSPGTLYFSPDSSLLAANGGNELGTNLRIWDVQTGKVLTTLDPHCGTVFDVVFHPTQRLVALSCDADTISLWNIDSGERVFTVRDFGFVMPFANLLMFSPDGSQLVFGSGTGQIWIWRTADGSNRAVLEGPEIVAADIDFSADGSLLVSGDLNGVVRVWDYATAVLLATIHEHSESLNAVAVHPEKTLIATASRDGTLRFWGIPSK